MQRLTRESYFVFSLGKNTDAAANTRKLLCFQFGHTQKKKRKKKIKKEKNQIKNSRKSKKEKNQNEEKMKEKNEKNEELCIGVEGFLDKLVFWVFALFLILKNVQRGAVVNT